MATPKKKPEEKKQMGRPTLFTAELADLICERVATSTLGLARLCELHEDLPHKSTINAWRFQFPDFSSQYARAKLFQADLLAEECLEIADNVTHDIKINPTTGDEYLNSEYVARSRLRIDTRKWLASKLLPKQYGQHAQEELKDKKSLIEAIIDKLAE